MLPTINFDDNFFLQADEIYYKRSHRMLPPEFPAAKLSVLEMIPEPSFGIG